MEVGYIKGNKLFYYSEQTPGLWVYDYKNKEEKQILNQQIDYAYGIGNRIFYGEKQQVEGIILNYLFTFYSCNFDGEDVQNLGQCQGNWFDSGDGNTVRLASWTDYMKNYHIYYYDTGLAVDEGNPMYRGIYDWQAGVYYQYDGKLMDLRTGEYF